MRICIGAVLLVGWLIAIPAASQNTGFLIVRGTRYGPASLSFNGAPQAPLDSMDVTFELAAGRYTVEIARPGYSRHREEIVIAVRDSVRITPRLERFRAHTPNGSLTGRAGPDPALLRALYIEPVPKAVRVDGDSLGATPLDVVVPQGDHIIMIGQTALCLRFSPQSQVTAQVGAGRAAKIDGAERCTPTLELLQDGPLGSPADSPPVLKNAREMARLLVREYPKELRDKGYGGSVEVSLLVDRDARVVKTVLTRPSSWASLNEAALRVVQRARFTPASHEGVQVPFWVMIPVVFKVN